VFFILPFSLSLYSIFYFWFDLFSLCLLHILAAAPSGVAGAQDAFFITVFEAFIQLFVKMFVWMRGDVWARSGWRGAFTYFEYRFIYVMPPLLFLPTYIKRFIWFHLLIFAS
jgi:hypothetical protein